MWYIFYPRGELFLVFLVLSLLLKLHFGKIILQCEHLWQFLLCNVYDMVWVFFCFCFPSLSLCSQFDSVPGGKAEPSAQLHECNLDPHAVRNTGNAIPLPVSLKAIRSCLFGLSSLSKTVNPGLGMKGTTQHPGQLGYRNNTCTELQKEW